MKKIAYYVLMILAAIYLSGCVSRVHHDDEFYNNDGDYPYIQFPLIKPYYVYRMNSESPWILNLKGHLWIDIGNYAYNYDIEDVRKLAVKDRVIMAYSPYVDEKPFDNEQVNQSIREHYYHWFAVIPDKNVEVGFESESEFLSYIQKLGIQQPDWREPVDIFNDFEQTGCLSWIPDCK